MNTISVHCFWLRVLSIVAFLYFCASVYAQHEHIEHEQPRQTESAGSAPHMTATAPIMSPRMRMDGAEYRMMPIQGGIAAQQRGPNVSQQIGRKPPKEGIEEPGLDDLLEEMPGKTGDGVAQHKGVVSFITSGITSATAQARMRKLYPNCVVTPAGNGWAVTVDPRANPRTVIEYNRTLDTKTGETKTTYDDSGRNVLKVEENRYSAGGQLVSSSVTENKFHPNGVIAESTVSNYTYSNGNRTGQTIATTRRDTSGRVTELVNQTYVRNASGNLVIQSSTSSRNTYLTRAGVTYVRTETYDLTKVSGNRATLISDTGYRPCNEKGEVVLPSDDGKVRQGAPMPKK